MQESSGKQPKEEQEEAVEDEENDLDAEFISTNGWQDIPRGNFTLMAIFVMAFAIEKKSINVPEENLNGHLVKLKTKSEIIFAIAD